MKRNGFKWETERGAANYWMIYLHMAGAIKEIGLSKLNTHFDYQDIYVYYMCTIYLY